MTPTFVEHVHCSRCGTRCSGVDPELGLVVRAWVECPECLERAAMWQPIATAPKDGQWLWLLNADTGRISAFKWDTSQRGGGMWFAGTGWWHQVDTLFSHWMPLGAPPAAVERGTSPPPSPPGDKP